MDRAEMNKHLAEECLPIAQEIYQTVRTAIPEISNTQLAVIGMLLAARCCADESLCVAEAIGAQLSLMCAQNLIGAAAKFYQIDKAKGGQPPPNAPTTETEQ